MLTATDDLRALIVQKKADIEENNRQIEAAEERQRLRRQHGEKMYNRLVALEEQLRREEACLVRPQPEGVKAGPISI